MEQTITVANFSYRSFTENKLNTSITQLIVTGYFSLLTWLVRIEIPTWLRITAILYLENSTCKTLQTSTILPVDVC